jgi:hypothetical protein
MIYQINKREGKKGENNKPSEKMNIIIEYYSCCDERDETKPI